MLRRHVPSVLVILSGVLLLLVGPGAIAPSVAADCGDTSGAGGADLSCSCGDTVTTDTTLDDTDPVTSAVCSCDGLIVSSSVTLDLGGHTIRGSRVCDGINIGGDVAGSDAVIGGGRITNFGTGVAEIGEGGANRLHDLQVVDNADRGVFLMGRANVVEDCVVSRNGGRGIELDSDNEGPGDGVVRNCRVEDNRGDGITVDFTGNLVESNIARRNTGTGIVACCRGNLVRLNRAESNGQGIAVDSHTDFPGFVTRFERNIALRNHTDGIEISGEGVLVDRNQSKYNRGEGFQVTGSRHTFTLNIAVDNDQDGYTVFATDSVFERNTANYNGLPDVGYGILDGTTDTGTSVTANTYTGNRCTGNGLGDSSPAGLCH
jgi:hypothetical protein